MCTCGPVGTRSGHGREGARGMLFGECIGFLWFPIIFITSNEYVIIALICIEFLLTSMVSLVWERLIACLPAGTSRMLVGDCIGCL